MIDHVSLHLSLLPLGALQTGDFAERVIAYVIFDDVGAISNRCCADGTELLLTRYLRGCDSPQLLNLRTLAKNPRVPSIVGLLSKARSKSIRWVVFDTVLYDYQT